MSVVFWRHLRVVTDIKGEQPFQKALGLFQFVSMSGTYKIMYFFYEGAVEGIQN